MIVREDDTRTHSRSGGDPETTVSGPGIAVGSARLDEQGLNMNTEVSPLIHSQIVLRARHDAAYLALGVGPVGIAESVKKGTPGRRVGG